MRPRGPRPLVVRSRVASCNTTGTLSAVSRTSSSMASAPCAAASSNAAMVFSGALPDAPRCAMIGRAERSSRRLHLAFMSIADLRRDYARARLDEANVSSDPVAQFERWFAEARDAKVMDPNAMALATATREGSPSVRMVLLKGVDQRGFVFFTDYRSQKGVELENNPRAALVFTRPVAAEESDAYFRSRPLSS